MGAVLDFPLGGRVSPRVEAVDLKELGNGLWRVSLRGDPEVLIGEFPHGRAMAVAFNHATHRGVNVVAWDDRRSIGF